jgi:hypothetical protein
MATRLEKQSKEEVRAVIHFLHVRHVSVAMVRRYLVDVYGKEVTSHRSVAKMCSDFRRGPVGQRTMTEVADGQQQAPPEQSAC